MELLLPLLLFLPDSARYAIGLGLGLGVVITSLYYMIAYALQHAPLFAMAKEELSTLLFSIIIIVFWISTGATLDPLVQSLVVSSSMQGQLSGMSTSHVTLAIASMDILFHKIIELYTSMYLFEALIGFLSTISFPMGSPVAGTAIISLTIMPFDGLVLLSNAHTIVVESIGYLIGVVSAKKFLLLFARDCIPIIFLPLGLVFRAIPFLRTTGSSIIAICFAGFYVLPLAMLFSNFLIFDVYQPSEFTYIPEQMGVYKSGIGDQQVGSEIDESRRKGTELIELFTQTDVAKSSTQTSECAGNAVSESLCSAGIVIKSIVNTVWGFAKNVFHIWTFMMGLTGDFFAFAFANPVLPASASAGLYFFIIDAVVAHGQFLVIIVVTSLFEIIFTITMYRNIAMLIGGELEIAGLGKLV